MKLSIVTTLYRSAPYVEEFHRRITAQARAITDEYEIIMVDDGSPDDALAVALRLAQDDPRILVVELSRNFGHHAAMMTGLSHAQGELVFLIDVDLEEPPELLGRFHAALREAEGRPDVVYGCQEERQGALVKRWGGALGWWTIDLLLPIKIPHSHSTVRLMTRAYTQALVSYRERQTAIGGLWVLTGFRQLGLTFQKKARPSSSYTAWKRFRVLVDSVTSFSELPLFFILCLGIFLLFVSSIFATVLIVNRILGTVGEGWTSVMVSIWLIGGILVFCIGILGLYVSRIFIETKNRPYAIVRQIHGRGLPQ